MQNRENFASVNHGRPTVAATARPGDFSAHSAVAARAAGGEYHAPTISPREARTSSNSFNRGNSTPGNHGNANEGFRPFTPPSHGGNSNATMNENRGNSTPSNRGGANEGFRPFNAPSGSGNANANRGGNFNQNANQNRGNEGRPQNQPQVSHSNQGASQNRPNPQPQHRSGPPPKEEHHH